MHQTSPLIAQQITSAAPPSSMNYISTIGVVVIGLLAAWIAFRQFQIARNKLKLDLYDKRMVVYDVVRKTLGAATAHGKLTQDEEITYLSGIQTAKWLFGPEVFNYLDETLWHKIVDFGLHNAMLSGPPSPDRTQHIRARADTMKWMAAQYKEFDKICSPYLQLRH